jgi:hypothetical protein
MYIPDESRDFGEVATGIAKKLERLYSIRPARGPERVGFAGHHLIKFIYEVHNGRPVTRKLI